VGMNDLILWYGPFIRTVSAVPRRTRASPPQRVERRDRRGAIAG
jgi:hypothetical protein